MQKDKVYQNQLIKNQYRKNNESSPKKRLNYSFSKEFINTFSDEDDNVYNSNLAKSHLDLGDIIKMEENILGESKEASSTILDEKIKKKLYSKNINNQKLNVFANLNDIDPNEIEKNNIKNNNFLKIRELPNISRDIFVKMKSDLLDENYLKELKNFILDFKYEINSSNSTLAIGSLFPLEKLIESNFNNDSDYSNEMIAKYNILKQYIFTYRTTKGDGNCFYRAVMFRYFEIIILNKEIILLQNIIFDMKKSFYSNEIISRKEIKMNTTFKPELPLKIMLIILDLLKKNNEELAHLIFLKSLLICPVFDFGLIFYFRYIIYTYIRENEDKLYLKNFPIKIGNLLPSKYETEDGEFLFNSFYQNYLLKMFMDAEKIIIYLTPFILGMNLDIIIFDDESEIIKKINYEGKPEHEFDDKIFLMNKRNHYEIIYNKNYYEKYKTIFNKYINNDFLKESIIKYEIDKKVSFSNNTNRNYIINNYKNASDIDYSFNYNKNANFKESISKPIIKKNKTKKTKNTNKINNYLKSDLYNNSYKNEIDSNNQKNIHYNTIEISSNNIYNYIDNNNNLENIEKEKNNYKINNDEEKKKENILINIQNNNLNVGFKNFYKQNEIKKKRARKANKNIVNNVVTNNKYIEENNLLNKEISINGTKENNLNYPNTERIITNDSNISNYINKNIKIPVKKKITKKKKKENEYLDSNINNDKNILSFSKEKNKIEIINTDINISNNIKPKTKSLTKEKRVLKTKKIVVKNYTCKNCSEKYSIKQEYQAIFNLCNKCLKEKIIINFYDIYLSYIKNCLKNEYEDEEIKIKFKALLKNSITINDKSTFLEESINQLCNYYQTQKKPFDANYQDIIIEIKKNVCLICCHKMNNNQEDKITVPCGCNFCSNHHFEFFFKEKKPIHIEKEFLCYCSYKYNIKDIYNLGLQFSKLYHKFLRKSVIDYLNNILKGQCCICKSKELCQERIRYKDNEMENQEILSNYKELKHYFCKNCSENIKEKNRFKCNVCYTEHIFKPRK